MVTCRCGCKFENSSRDSHVMCPECKRIYPNSAPDIVHPKSVDELRWDCPECGATNDSSCAGAPRISCEKCGAKRPGSPEDWYGIG